MCSNSSNTSAYAPLSTFSTSYRGPPNTLGRLHRRMPSRACGGAIAAAWERCAEPGPSLRRRHRATPNPNRATNPSRLAPVLPMAREHAQPGAALCSPPLAVSPAPSPPSFGAPRPPLEAAAAPEPPPLAVPPVAPPASTSTTVVPGIPVLSPLLEPPPLFEAPPLLEPPPGVDQ